MARFEPFPEDIESERYSLTSWKPTSKVLVDARIDLIARNFAELSRWMPWMKDEPLNVEATERLFMSWEAARQMGVEAFYAMQTPDAMAIGSLGLHRRFSDAGVEIGFWIDHQARGHGLVPKYVNLAVGYLFSSGLADYAEIHVDPANLASRRVAAKCGFSFQGEVPEPIVATSQTGSQQVWRRSKRRADGSA